MALAPLSRRAFLRHAPAVVVAGALATPLAAEAAPVFVKVGSPVLPHTDAALLALGRSFEKAYEAERAEWAAIEAMIDAADDYKAACIEADRRMDAAHNATSAIVEQIEASRATTLEGLLSRLDRSEIDAANTLMRKEGHRSRQIIAEIADDGTVTYREMPDIRQIDYITRALNDRAQANAGLGALGGQTNEGRVFANLATEIRNVTRTAVPEYDAALRTAADPIRRSQAVQRGSELLRARTTREQVAEWVADITPAERDALLQGIRSNLDDTIANVQRAVADGNMEAREAIAALRILSSRSAREKLRLAIGDDQAADELLAEIDRIVRSFELRAGVADNSRTFQRQEMNRRVNELTDPDGIVGALGKGEPINALKRGTQTLTGMTPGNALRRKDAMMEEAAGVLTRRGPAARNSLAALSRFNTATQASSARTVTLRQLIEAGGANAANLATQRSLDYMRP